MGNCGTIKRPVLGCHINSIVIFGLRTAGVLLLLGSTHLRAFDLGGDVDFYPFPTYKNSRNDGNTYGGVLVFLVVNEKHEIEHVIAPYVQYNDFAGTAGGLLAFGYPTRHSEYKVVLGWSEEIDREVRLSYANRRWWDGKYDIGFKVEYSQAGQERFFGLGPSTEESDETNFANEEIRSDVRFGLNLSENLTVGVGARGRDIEIFEGNVTSVPFVRDRFPDVTGVDGASVLGGRIYLTFDTRDNSQTPTQGEYLGVEVEEVGGLSGDTPDQYQRYLIEGKKLFPFGEERRYVLVLRSKVELQSGPEAPFWDQPSLGGDNSLRAFGDDRWIDRHAWVFNVEQRIKLYSFELFDYPLELEAAPFVDVGSVFGEGGAFDNVQVNPGVAIRLLSRPNIVGGMSASWGEDGFLIVGGFSFPF